MQLRHRNEGEGEDLGEGVADAVQGEARMGADHEGDLIIPVNQEEVESVSLLYPPNISII